MIVEALLPSVRQVNPSSLRTHTMRTATATELFTTENDFNEFLDVGSTPDLENVKRQLQDKIAAFRGNVRSALKDLYEARLTAVRQELAAR
jgi:hypothetical protein